MMMSSHRHNPCMISPVAVNTASRFAFQSISINKINVAEEKRPKKDEKVGQPLVSHLSAKVGD